MICFFIMLGRFKRTHAPNELYIYSEGRNSPRDRTKENIQTNKVQISVPVHRKYKVLSVSLCFFVFNSSTQFLPTCLLPQRESCQSWIPITLTVMMLCLRSFSLTLSHTNTFLKLTTNNKKRKQENCGAHLMQHPPHTVS